MFLFKGFDKISQDSSSKSSVTVNTRPLNPPKSSTATPCRSLRQRLHEFLSSKKTPRQPKPEEKHCLSCHFNSCPQILPPDIEPTELNITITSLPEFHWTNSQCRNYLEIYLCEKHNVGSSKARQMASKFQGCGKAYYATSELAWSRILGDGIGRELCIDILEEQYRSEVWRKREERRDKKQKDLLEREKEGMARRAAVKKAVRLGRIGRELGGWKVDGREGSGLVLEMAGKWKGKEFERDSLEGVVAMREVV